jgi:hypothetical protein
MGIKPFVELAFMPHDLDQRATNRLLVAWQHQSS